ncbi:2OG-Fe(II) oxygenase family protein [Moorena sp. SIO4G3]|uniref:2OG-Fe(II) oxygenase family protein n=1 Tax=Moorena sp. SIO4G3 TaxID=2607821 RepID=UPI0013C72C6D|nr:2OG-Fe(II) oxygenase family protein [Moorena sp. SIO4G3]NEO79900.1 isopenicillin N synthase family oxygenase [Moorena sp. SIO4G3]NEO90205.1 isopenicillin N synthase family oxygenase [Moorena sp. SIO3G5]
MQLPKINAVDTVTLEEINTLVHLGCCYVKIPEKEVFEDFEVIKKEALAFFIQDEIKKQKWLVNDKLEGYINRSIDDIQSVQQFFFRLHNPIGPFQECRNSVFKISNYFEQRIVLVLLKEVFRYFGVEQYFEEVVSDRSSTFSTVYYPAKVNTNKKCNSGLKAHKDFDLMSVLLIEKPGLEVFWDDQWHEVNPQPGYVVVILAQTLEKMLGGKTHSILHRVRIPDEERLSLAVFLGPNTNIPIQDYIHDQILFDSYDQCLKYHYYQLFEQ